MITLDPVKLAAIKPISFGKSNNNSNNNSKVGLMAVDKNSSSQVNFEKDLYITQNADAVQTKNPVKVLYYNLVKAYNILVTPRRNNNENYIHLPYMA